MYKIKTYESDLSLSPQEWRLNNICAEVTLGMAIASISLKNRIDTHTEKKIASQN